MKLGTDKNSNISNTVYYISCGDQDYVFVVYLYKHSTVAISTLLHSKIKDTMKDYICYCHMSF